MSDYIYIIEKYKIFSWALFIMAKRLFYGYIFAGVLCFALYFVFGIATVTSFLWVILLLFFIVYIFQYIIQIILQREPKKFIEFFVVGLYRCSIIISVLFILVWAFCYYQNSLNPAMFPLYTISNGEKTIQFQTMSHIGTSAFYRKVQQNIFNAKRDGYVLFYEWVKSGSPENQETFEKLLGIELSDNLYENYSKLYGVVPQNNEDFLGIVNKKDFNVDLDIDSMVDIYIQKTLSLEEQEQYQKGVNLSAGEKVRYNLDFWEVQNIDSAVLERLNDFNEEQLAIVRYFNKALLNFFFKNQALQDKAFQILGKEDIFKVILDERDIYLAWEIHKTNFPRIFVIYGLLHFEGVYKELQRLDSNWQIITIEKLSPLVDNPLFSG